MSADLADLWGESAREPQTADPRPKEKEMPIQPGVTFTEPADLPGKWQVWSQTGDSPGAHAFVPADETARATGIKYAIIRAKFTRGAARPLLTLIRTDPSGLTPA